MKSEGKISLLSAVLMSINIIVGVGIYFGPQLMAAEAGTFSFLGWALVGCLLFPIIWTVAVASRLFPDACGFYSYGKYGINEDAGFIALWGYWLGFTACAATQSVVFRDVISSQISMPFFDAHPFVFNACLLGILGALNLLAVEWISRVQSFSTIIKLLPIICVILLTPFYWWTSPVTYNVTDLSNLGATIPMALFGFWGFESACSISGYLKGGPSKAFFVILTAFFSVVFMYTFFHFGLIHIMGAAALMREGVQEFPQFMGIDSKPIVQFLQNCFIITLIINFMNAIYGVMLANICNLHNFASRKLIFFSGSLTKVNRFHRPFIAVFVQSLFVFLLMSVAPSKEILIALTNLGVIVAFFITILAVLLTQLRRKQYVQSLMSVGGFATLGVLIYYTWTRYMGPDIQTRLLYAAPLLIALVLGYAMFKYLKAQRTTQVG